MFVVVTGDWTIALSKAVGPTGEVTGIYFSENMLEVGKEKTASMENVKLVHGDAMELPFEHIFFDYVTIGFWMEKCARLFSRVKSNE